MPQDAPVQEEEALERSPWRRGRVLLTAGAFVAIALALYAASPWLLPLSIVEGPMVQQLHRHGAHVVWYTSRSDSTTFELELSGAWQALPPRSDGARHVVRLEGLEPASSYRYRISGAGRTLAQHELRAAGAADAPFSFIVFGDSGRNSREQYALAALMPGVRPDFLVHTGDVVYPDGSRRRYRERFFQPYEALLPRIPIWPSLGNHDVSKPGFGAAYREVFELPENGPPGLTPGDNYWFDHGGARFVVLDSNWDPSIREREERDRQREARLREQVAPWITTVLADAPPWRFAVFHHPPYTGGKYAPDEVLQRTIVPALEAGGVQVVFTGHDHMYQRTLPLRGGEVVGDGAGIVYVVSGAGGAALYTPRDAPRPAYIAVLNADVHSFTHVEIDGDRLRLRQIAVDGGVLDEWSMQRSAAAAGAPRVRPVSAAAPGR